jgi:DNA polymerase-3 subunit epsilon
VTGLSFVGVDVETANSNRGSICSFGLAVVEDGVVIRREHWLTRPPEEIGHFDGFNVSLHGIHAADVASSPPFAERLAQVLDVIGDRPIVSHNAAFDVGAIRGGCDADQLDWPSLTYGCSLVMSRRSLQLLSYRLPLVCDALDIPLEYHHRADADAEASARIVLALASLRDTPTLEDLAYGLQCRLGRLSPSTWAGCIGTYLTPRSPDDYAVRSIPPDANSDADPEHPFYGQVMVFTGALSIRRADAWATVAHMGAIPESGVTKKTNFHVIGDGFAGESVSDFHTGKAEKAARRNAKGANIEVLTERDFFELLEDRHTSGTRQLTV